MAKLRSGSTTDHTTMGMEINPDHLILCLAAALKSPDIVGHLNIHRRRDEFADLISSELVRQLKPFKDVLEAKDQEIKALKKLSVNKIINLNNSNNMGSVMAGGYQVFLRTRHQTTLPQPSWSSVRLSKTTLLFSRKILQFGTELARQLQENPNRFVCNLLKNVLGPATRFKMASNQMQAR